MVKNKCLFSLLEFINGRFLNCEVNMQLLCSLKHQSTERGQPQDFPKCKHQIKNDINQCFHFGIYSIASKWYIYILSYIHAYIELPIYMEGNKQQVVPAFLISIYSYSKSKEGRNARDRKGRKKRRKFPINILIE